jgi:glucosamine--fructose-6-phosphate aminotransferase (isomerizing)
MRREIDEQPAVVAATLEALTPVVGRLADAMRARDVGTVLLLARGTSDHAAVYGRYLLEARCGLVAGLAAPSIWTAYRPRLDLSRTLVLAVSQSGRTPEIVSALDHARGCGALTAALTNGADSPLAAGAEHRLVTLAGVEQSVAATKTFTTALAALAALAGALGAEACDDASLAAVPEAMRRTLDLAGPTIEDAARRLASAQAAVCAARGLALCVALEGALKLKEATGVWAEGYSAADLRHGPTAAARGLPALVFHGGGPLADDVEALATELEAGGSDVVGVGAGRDLPVSGGVAEELAPLLLVLPAQLVAERLARLRGRDPDRPPGLGKVTMTY